MGLKIRRLKHGFAYYAEYKFGAHCIYETVKAASIREAKRHYTARYRELREKMAPQPAARPITRRAAHESQINALLASLLKALIARGVLSDADAHELLDNAFRQLDAMSAAPESAAMAARSRDSMRQQILEQLAGPPPSAAAVQIIATLGEVSREAAAAAGIVAPPTIAPIELVPVQTPPEKDSERVHG